MTDPITDAEGKILLVLSIVHGESFKADRYKWFLEGLRDFLQVANPRFPRDTVNLIEMALLADRSSHLPSGEEVALLEKCWQDAWDWSGELRWSYHHPTLTLKYSPKKTGRYYTVTFSPQEPNGIPLGLPLQVRAEVYMDMDDLDNHGDGCDGDDCNCEGGVERREELVFTDSEGFQKKLTDWLSKVIHLS
jgi:hypothetical protein